MALTQLDAQTALVVIDLQKGVVGMNTVPHSAESVVERSARLAAAFRSQGLPVVLVNVKGGAPGRTDAGPMASAPRSPDWADLVPELQAQPSDILVTKMAWGAFTGTSLDLLLRRRGVTQVILTGISTSIGVETTARTAFELGYHVVLVTDAMADRDDTNHQHAVERVFPRLGETTTTDDVIGRLNQR